MFQMPARIQPVAERQVHRLEAKGMGDILNEDSRLAIGCNRAVKNAEGATSEAARETMDPNPTLRPMQLRVRRGPYIDLISSFRKTTSNDARVIAHSSRLRRVLSRYYMPM